MPTEHYARTIEPNHDAPEMQLRRYFSRRREAVTPLNQNHRYSLLSRVSHPGRDRRRGDRRLQRHPADHRQLIVPSGKSRWRAGELRCRDDPSGRMKESCDGKKPSRARAGFVLATFLALPIGAGLGKVRLGAPHELRPLPRFRRRRNSLV